MHGWVERWVRRQVGKDRTREYETSICEYPVALCVRYCARLDLLSQQCVGVLRKEETRQEQAE